MMNPAPITDVLDGSLLSNILAGFCDGKAISTFSFALSGNFRARAYNSPFVTARDALVRRYVELAHTCRKDCEIRDTCDVIRETIRTTDLPRGHDSEYIAHAVRKISEWCAVLDYFEAQLTRSNAAALSRSGECSPHWIVWCGAVETPFGRIKTYFTSPTWSAESLHSFFRSLEAVDFNLVRTTSRVANFDDGLPSDLPFGTMAGLTETDAGGLYNLMRTLEHTVFERDGIQSSILLTHLRYEYTDEQPLRICSHGHPRWAFPDDMYPDNFHLPPWIREEMSLCCYWNGGDEGYDWEDTIDKLGENVIRIMTRFCASDDDFASSIKKRISNFN